MKTTTLSTCLMIGLSALLSLGALAGCASKETATSPNDIKAALKGKPLPPDVANERNAEQKAATDAAMAQAMTKARASADAAKQAQTQHH